MSAGGVFEEEDIRGCGEEELEGGGVGKVKVVCCKEGVTEEEEEESVGEDARMEGYSMGDIEV